MAACEVLGAAILISDEESGDLILFELDSTRNEGPVHHAIKSGEGWLAKTMQEGNARLLDAKDFAHIPVETHFDFSVTAGIVAPLEGDESSLGATGLFGHRKMRAFSHEDLELVRLLSSNISTAVRLHRAATARERTERLTAIGSLLSQVVHDFKTPMTVISGYAQLMVDSEDRTQRTTYAEEILRQFELVTSMQREVLEFARGESSIFVRRVYLARFFHDLVRQIEREISDLPIQLLTQVDAKASARFDEARIARAVHNLVRNAIEAMGEAGGRLTLHATTTNDSMIIEVSDTGPGIPATISGRIFQSFVTANKPGGTGLGLAIVKKIVDEHGGTVDVESSDKGATFRIILPQSPERPIGEHSAIAAAVAAVENRSASRPPPGYGK